MSNAKGRNDEGVVRQELAIILGILIILVSLVCSSYWAVRSHRMRAYARRDLRHLRMAGHRFYTDYGVWPTSHAGEYGDVRYGQDLPNAHVLNVLRALDGAGNEGHLVNPKRTIFVEVPRAGRGRSGLDESGSFIDPWGRPYQIALDTDLDDSCTIQGSTYGGRTGEGMAVWSLGADGESETQDDILSWQL